MSCFLTEHPLHYQLSPSEKFLSTFTLSGIPYAKRHWELANKPSVYSWAHRLIGLAECFPLLGIIIAKVERAIFLNFISPPPSPFLSFYKNIKVNPLIDLSLFNLTTASGNIALLQEITRHIANGEGVGATLTNIYAASLCPISTLKSSVFERNFLPQNLETEVNSIIPPHAFPSFPRLNERYLLTFYTSAGFLESLNVGQELLEFITHTSGKLPLLVSEANKPFSTYQSFVGYQEAFLEIRSSLINWEYLEEIPPLLATLDPFYAQYTCAITQKPIRYPVRIFTTKREAPVATLYEQATIRSWIASPGKKRPLGWPQEKEYGFSALAIDTDALEKINEHLKALSCVLKKNLRSK